MTGNILGSLLRSDNISVSIFFEEQKSRPNLLDEDHKAIFAPLQWLCTFFYKFMK